jgi:hypothetical protein
MVTCAALVAVRVIAATGPLLGNDSFQYLSMAENAVHGQIGVSSIVQFDAERSLGVIPTPVVTFPAGYPLVVALVSRLGFTFETAALLISALSMIACVPILAWLTSRMGLSTGARIVILGAFSMNALVSKYGGSALSEGLFTLVVMVGAALLVSAQMRPPGEGGRLWLAAGVAFGAAYFVRYAGLFLVVGLGVVCVRHLAARDHRVARGYAIALAGAGVAVLLGVVRNLVLVGRWQGGNEQFIPHDLVATLIQTAQSINAIVVYGPGHTSDAATVIARVLVLGLLYLVVLLVSGSYVRHRARASPDPAAPIAIDLLLLVIVYGVLMFAAALTSPISNSVRLFVPVAPLLLLSLGFVVDRMIRVVPRESVARRVSLLLLLASFIPYAFLNISAVGEPRTQDPSLVAAAFDASAPGSPSARAVIADLAGADGVIVASNGQEVGYALHRRTISFADPEWSDSTLRAAIEAYHAAAVVISRRPIGPGVSDLESDQPSPLLVELFNGTSPAWLKLVHRSADILIYAPTAGA